MVQAGDQALDLKATPRTPAGPRGPLALGILGTEVHKRSQIEEWTLCVLFKSVEASVGCVLSPGLLHSFNCYVFMNEWTYILSNQAVKEW